MADQVGIERQQSGEADRDDVEQTAIQIKVLVVEQRGVAETAGIIVDDQFAVAMLDFLVIRYAVVAE